jgi:uncharacterized membrane protein
VTPRRTSVVAGLLGGLGLATFVDEVVFHQILQWHHFYDKGTATAGVVSDGYLHAGSWIATVAALFMVADVQRRGGAVWRAFAGGVLLGAGAFQLYDGTVQHKLFGLHEIRYGVDLLPYDVAWNVVGGAGIVIGLLLLRGTSAREPEPAPQARPARRTSRPAPP